MVCPPAVSSCIIPTFERPGHRPLEFNALKMEPVSFQVETSCPPLGSDLTIPSYLHQKPGPCLDSFTPFSLSAQNSSQIAASLQVHNHCQDSGCCQEQQNVLTLLPATCPWDPLHVLL